MASELTQAPVLAPTGEEVLQREVVVEAPEQLASATLEERFEIERCAAAIRAEPFHRVALQFPDHLLSFAGRVYDALRERTEASLFLLGDTSFGECCVDEVAAEHAGADLIIHFGHSCLSRTTKIPALYAFGRCPVNVGVAQQIIAKTVDKQLNLLLLTAVEYAHAAEELAESLQEIYGTVHCARVDPSYMASVPLQPEQNEANATSLASCCGSSGACESSTPCNPKSTDAAAAAATCGSCSTMPKASAHDTDSTTEEALTLVDEPEESEEIDDPSREPAPIPAAVSARSAIETEQKRLQFGRANLPASSSLGEDTVVLYVGAPDVPFLRSFLMLYNQQRVFNFDPTTNACTEQFLRTNKALMRRYFMVQKAKEAQTVGIICGTLGVAHYMTLLESVKKLCTAAEKQFYTFLMGKINPAKLANFTEVDAYVLIACPETTLLDSTEFFKPVVTPFELELACAAHRDWDGHYELQFETIVQSIHEDLQEMEDAPAMAEPQFSLLSQSYLSRAADRDGDQGLGAVAVRANGGAILPSGGARTLAERTFQGLDQRLGETPVTKAIQGTHGIAIGYDNEPQ